MTNKEILELNGYDDNEYVCFTNPSFEGAIIGVTSDDRLVYDYNKMVVSAMKEMNVSEDEAIDWIDYNTIRALVYTHTDRDPIIIYPFEEME